MALIISDRQVYDLLLPWFGEGFLAVGQLVSSTAAVLRILPEKNPSFADLHSKIEKHIFMEVYRQTKGTMVLYADPKASRIHSSVFLHIADDVLSLYFLALRPNLPLFEKLKAYSMENEGLAALKALYLEYDEFQTVEETAFIKRMIINIYPPWRYEKWLYTKGEK